MRISRGLFDEHDPVAGGNRLRDRIQERRLARTSAAGDEHVVPGIDDVPEHLCEFAGQGADADQVVERVAVGELPDGQRGPVDGTRREHCGDSRPVLEPRVENRLALRDLIAAGARNVLDRHRQIPDLERAVR